MSNSESVVTLDLSDIERRLGQKVGGGQLWEPCNKTDIRRWVMAWTMSIRSTGTSDDGLLWDAGVGRASWRGQHMFLQNHFQNAYVTRDIKKAIALFRTHYDFENFMEFETANEISTPAGRGISVTKMALGWIGDLQYELIEPVSGMVDIFKADLPDRYPMRLHHICMRVSDWDSFRAEVDRRKWPVVIEGSGKGGQLQFIYVDARESLGHYLEYCWMTPERWAMLGGR